MPASWAHALGSFLRARRRGVPPERAGFAGGGARKVPGLRREEVALLAGVSVDYYVRLEQGRGIHPSTSVVGALARALQLDAAETAHLHLLASDRASTQRETSAGGGAHQDVRPGLLALVDSMLGPAVLLYGRRFEVLAANPLGTALFGDPLQHPPGHRSMAWLVFRHGPTRALFPDWEEVARDAVGVLRHEAARHPGDRLLRSLIDELSADDQHFRTWWAGHEVHERTHGSKEFAHPQVGLLTLQYETLTVAEDPDQSLVSYDAAAGTADAAVLERLRAQLAPARRGTVDAE